MADKYLLPDSSGHYILPDSSGELLLANLDVGRPINAGVAAPQRVEGIREAAGYAVVFGAVAALLVAAQPSPVGAAEYHVGTHQTAVASENRSWVKGTPPQLTPAAVSVVIVTPHYAAPQPIDDAFAHLSTYVYPAVAALDLPPPRTRVAAPEQLDTAAAWVWWTRGIAPPEPIGGVSYSVGTHGAAYAAQDGYTAKFGRFVTPAAAGTDVEIGDTLVAAPQQVDSGYAQRFGKRVVVAVVGADSRIGRTVVSAPEQIDSGYTRLSRYVYPAEWGITRYYEAGQDSTEQWGGAIWGFTPPAALGADVRISYTRVAAPQQIESGYTVLFGQQPATASTVIPKTRISAPEQINSGDGWVWGPFAVAQIDSPTLRTMVVAPPHINTGDASVWGLFRPFVPGTDVRVGKFHVAAEPFYEPVQYGVRFSFKQYLAAVATRVGRRIVAGALGRRGKASLDRIVQAKRRNRKLDSDE